MNKNMIRRFATTTAAAALFVAPAIALAPAAVADTVAPVTISAATPDATDAPEGYDWMYDELEGEYVLVPQVGPYGIVPLTDINIDDLSVSGDDDFVGDLDNDALAGHGIAAVSIELGGEDFVIGGADGEDAAGETSFVCADDDGNIVECLVPDAGDIDRSHLTRPMPIPGGVDIEPISADLNPIAGTVPGTTQSSPAVTAALIVGSLVVIGGSVVLAHREHAHAGTKA